jgi:hypothetical protein
MSSYYRPIYQTLIAPGVQFFRNRKEYEEAAVSRPNWPKATSDAGKRIKRWIDPSALTSNRQTMRYPNAIDLDRSGSPIIINRQVEIVPGYSVAVEDAATCNFVDAYEAGSKLVGEVPVPLRLLTEDEELIPAPGGFGDFDVTGIVLRIKSEWAKYNIENPTLAGVYSAILDLREFLQRKLGP